MSRMVGSEIGAGIVRAVVGRGATARQTYEQPFTADDLPAAVSALQALVGDVAGIGLAIGLAHLHVKQVKLPPVLPRARRQLLLVEPERWFPVPSGTPTAIALDTAGVIALGADGAFVDACVAAFAAWAPVQRVEAAPMALARALKAAGTGAAIAALDAGATEVGSIETRNGVLCSVRRARANDLAASPVSPPLAKDLDAEFNVALGAAIGFDGEISTMLLTPALERAFVGAQRRRLTVWTSAALVAACAVMMAAGISRDRLLNAIESDLATARKTSHTGATLALQAMAIDRELAAISTTTASRADVVAAMAALGARLPVEAVAQRVRVVGKDWQVEGNARTASAVLAALAAEPQFEKVRFLAPSNRFRDGAIDRETFAIAFALR